MTTRAVGPMAGLGWLKNAVNLGRSNPKAVFGGAALLAITMLVVAFGAGLLQATAVAMLGPGMTIMAVSMVLLTLVMLVLISMLIVGFLRLIHAVENNSPARALDVFGGFGDLATSLRTIGLVVVLAIVQNVLLVGLLAVFASGVVGWYAQVMQASMAGAPPPMAALPEGLGIATLLAVVIGVVMYGVQAIGLCQIALRDRGILPALGDGFAGAFKNLLPLLVFTIAVVVAMVVVGVVVLLLAMLVGVLAKIAGAWLAVVLGVPLYLLGVLAMYVVMLGAMYHLWRDVCGDDVVAAPGEALTA